MGRFIATFRVRHRLHSQPTTVHYGSGYAVAGREPVTIHPQDATTRGIVDGDTVRVWNHRGRFWRARSRQMTEFGPRSVFTKAHGRTLKPTAGGSMAQKRRGKRPDKDLPSSRLNGCAGNTALVWFEKSTGPALPLTAFSSACQPHNNYRVGGILPAVRYLQYENQAHGRSLRRLIFSGKPQGSAEENVAGHIPQRLPMPSLRKPGATTAPRQNASQSNVPTKPSVVHFPSHTRVCAAGKIDVAYNCFCLVPVTFF